MTLKQKIIYGMKTVVETQQKIATEVHLTRSDEIDLLFLTPDEVGNALFEIINGEKGPRGLTRLVGLKIVWDAEKFEVR